MPRERTADRRALTRDFLSHLRCHQGHLGSVEAVGVSQVGRWVGQALIPAVLLPSTVALWRPLTLPSLSPAACSAPHPASRAWHL
jgi:hypothetical protein